MGHIFMAKFSNMKIEINESQPLDEIVVDVEGGIDQVKDTFSFAFKHGADELTEYGKRLKQAIADMGSMGKIS